MAECKALGFEGLDFVYINGDAYIDHPSFGAAIIARTLQAHGFTVGIIAQPDWHDVEAFRALGKPRLAFLVSSGNIDSMVNHYTAAKRRRSDDAYTPDGRAGARPDYCTITYLNVVHYDGIPNNGTLSDLNTGTDNGILNISIYFSTFSNDTLLYAASFCDILWRLIVALCIDSPELLIEVELRNNVNKFHVGFPV